MAKKQKGSGHRTQLAKGTVAAAEQGGAKAGSRVSGPGEVKSFLYVGGRDCQVALPLEVDWNGNRFGAAHGHDMSIGFDGLIAHAAYSRDLVAGTVIGSGTVSNENYREVGSSCIAERRGIEMLDEGAPKTPFLSFGDRVRMEARMPDGAPVFGAIDQIVRGAHS